MVIEVSLKTTTPGSFDLPRSSRMLAIGLFHGAPRHFFYVRLEKSGKSLKLKSNKKLFAGIPGTSLKCAAKKVFFDQAGLCDCYSDGDDEEDKCENIDSKLTDMARIFDNDCAGGPLGVHRHHFPLRHAPSRGQGTLSRPGEYQRQVCTHLIS